MYTTGPLYAGVVSNIGQVVCNKSISRASVQVTLECVCRAGGSVDTELDRVTVEVTPVRSGVSRSVFGSIERGMDRIKMILTPKKRLNSTADGPRKVKVNKSGNSIYPTFIQSLFVTRLSNQYSVLDLAYNPLKNRQLEFTAKILDFAIYVCMYVHESGRARRIVTLRDGVLGHP